MYTNMYMTNTYIYPCSESQSYGTETRIAKGLKFRRGAASVHMLPPRNYQALHARKLPLP